MVMGSVVVVVSEVTDVEVISDDDTFFSVVFTSSQPLRAMTESMYATMLPAIRFLMLQPDLQQTAQMFRFISGTAQLLRSGTLRKFQERRPLISTVRMLRLQKAGTQ